MTDQVAMREAFERHARMVGCIDLYRHGDGYGASDTESLWHWWQAACAWNIRAPHPEATCKDSLQVCEVVSYCVPTGRATQDGSMEDGPEYLVFADAASEYEKRIGSPLYAKPIATAADIRDAAPKHRCPTCDGPCDMFEEEGNFEIAYVYRSTAK